MKKNRSGFAFELALVIISLLSIAILVLIVMFYRSKTDAHIVYSPPPEEFAESIKKNDANTYLENIENYEEQVETSLSEEELEKTDKTNLVARSSEVGENSVIKAVDDIVAEALVNTPIEKK